MQPFATTTEERRVLTIKAILNPYTYMDIHAAWVRVGKDFVRLDDLLEQAGREGWPPLDRILDEELQPPAERESE